MQIQIKIVLSYFSTAYDLIPVNDSVWGLYGFLDSQYINFIDCYANQKLKQDDVPKADRRNPEKAKKDALNYHEELMLREASDRLGKDDKEAGKFLENCISRFASHVYFCDTLDEKAKAVIKQKEEETRQKLKL